MINKIKNIIRFVIDIIFFCLFEINKRKKVLCLILLIPLAEIKAIFYHSNIKIKSGIFVGNPRYLCNVLESYADVIIFGVIFYYISNVDIDKETKETAKFLFILNVLDLIHLGLLDMQYLVIAKLLLAYAIYYLWSKLRHSY